MACRKGKFYPLIQNYVEWEIKYIPFGVFTPFLTDFETFWSLDPCRVRRVSHTSARQLSSPSASEVASSEVSAIAEVKFAPLAVQVMISLGRA